MNGEQHDRALEAALQLYVSRRCERAYVHDLRNTLQPLQSGIEVLLKLAGGKSSSVTPERVAGIVRNAMTAHEQSIERTVKELTLHDEARSEIDATSIVRDIVRFLNNDATARGVTLRAGNSAALTMQGRPGRVRLLLLGVTLRAVDSTQQGQELTLDCRADGDSAIIEVSPVRNEWTADERTPRPDDWMLRAVHSMAAGENGTIETVAGSAGAGHTLRITFPV